VPQRGFERALLIATYGVLCAVGVLLATIEAFLVPARLTGGIEGLSAVMAVVGNLGIGLLGGFGTRTTAGAVAPAVGWLVVMFVLAVYAPPGGDVVIPGRLPSDPGVVAAGVVTLMAGLLASIVPIPLSSRYTTRVNPPKGLS